MAWVNSMQASLSSQELASNVSGAERLLNKHKVREREWGGREGESWVGGREGESWVYAK